MYRWAAIAISLSGVSCFAQPVIRSQSPVVNSASYRTPGLPGSGIAQGSIFSVFGTGLGPASCVTNAPTFPLLTTLGETSVKVTVGTTSTDAVMLVACGSQINAIMPSKTPVGDGTVTVTYKGQASAPAPVHVVAGTFGIFAANMGGAGQAIATHPNYVSNSIIRTFHPGDYGILWGTGLGAISGSDAAEPPVGDIGDVKVYVGTGAAAVNYHGRSGCCAGLDQIVFQVPQGVQGCHVPIAVETGGVVSNVATIAVSTSGQTCTDSIMGQDLVDKLAAGQKVDFGYIRLESIIAQFISGSSAAGASDNGYASFSEYTPQTAAWANYGVSAGYCIAVDGNVGGTAEVTPSQLDAGAITVQGPGPMITLTQYYFGYYTAVLNATISRFLWSGLNYTVAGGGGSKVGAFSISENTSIAGAQFTGIKWGEPASLSGDMTLQWDGGDAKLQSGNVTIGGISGNDDFSLSVSLQCVAPLSAHKFTIPAWIPSTLPPSGSRQVGTITVPNGFLWIGQYSNPVKFQATGLDKGIITDSFSNGVGLFFR
jgi:uncharacterized protein (TIGR03437 family)